ncbi:MAG: RIO1 family regulatory kinase/ATPase [Candidatus Aenigmatarchaeota archaeon]
MSLDFKEGLKVFSKVLDDLTIKALVELRNRRVIFGLVGIIKEGKESVIFLGKDFEKNFIAIKIYRIYHSDFKMMRNLLVLDSRYGRIKREKRNVVFAWCNREYRNLRIAYEKGKVSCPRPIISYQNILVMEFLGENGVSYPQLKDVNLDYQSAKNFYFQIIENMKNLKKIGLVHGDLSEHNILVGNDRIYLIDFSHGVRSDSIVYDEMFKRDLENINRFFSNFLSEEELILDI